MAAWRSGVAKLLSVEHKISTGMGLVGDRLRAGMPSLYVTSHYNWSSQPRNPPWSLNLVPAVSRWCKDENVTSAGWQVTLCGVWVPAAVRQVANCTVPLSLLCWTPGWWSDGVWRWTVRGGRGCDQRAAAVSVEQRVDGVQLPPRCTRSVITCAPLTTNYTVLQKAGPLRNFSITSVSNISHFLYRKSAKSLHFLHL